MTTQRGETTFGTALALAPSNRDTSVAGPRVIEVRVDVPRARRLLVAVDQAVLVTLDVGGKSTVTYLLHHRRRPRL